MEKQQKKSNKKRIWDIIVYSFAGLLILLGAGLLISENVVFSDYSPPPTMPAQTPHITPDTSETALPSTAPEPTVTPEPTPAAAPMYIYFPRFEIQSLVKPVGLADDGSIGTIDAADIADTCQSRKHIHTDSGSLVTLDLKVNLAREQFQTIRDKLVYRCDSQTCKYRTGFGSALFSGKEHFRACLAFRIRKLSMFLHDQCGT